MTETAKWYEKAGNCGDVVISTRVRLARNLKQYPFPARATDKQREAVEQKVKDALLSGNSILSKEFRFLPLESASEEEAVSLVERHIVSPEFISDRRGKAVLISEDESISIMINEEDHLRIQVLREGLSLKEAAETADRIDTLLSETLDFAYDGETWTLADDPDYPLDQDIVTKMASTLCSLKSQWSITSPEADSVYGLDSPDAIVTLTGSDGTTVTARFGAVSAEDDTVSYLQASTAPDVVYEISSSNLSAYAYTKDSLQAATDETATEESSEEDIIAENPVGGADDYVSSVPADE